MRDYEGTMDRTHSAIPGRTCTTAFTLVELLTVVAIICILSAILLPVFGTAREKARQATCMSNLNQIGLSMSLYMQDADETYPASATGKPCHASAQGQLHAGCAPAGQTIPELLDPYIRIASAWKCPDAINRDGLTTDYGIAEYLGRQEYTGGNSGNQGNGNGGSWKVYTSALSDNTAPANLVMATDIMNVSSAPFGTAFPSIWSECNNTISTCADNATLVPPTFVIKGLKNNWGANMSTDKVWPAPRHNGRCMALYTDGHVKLADVGYLIAHNVSGDPQCQFCNGY